VGILESAQILEKSLGLLFFRVIEAECRRQNMRILYREVSMTAQVDGDRQSTLRISYKTLSFIYSSANHAYAILRIFQRVVIEESS
jgi:hypothetical protein